MYKTIFARFGNIKSGKFIKDEDGQSLNDIAKVLGKFNIQLYDTEGNMKDLSSVLDTVHDKWDGLNDVQRNAISSAIAGVRQRENFLVLMENYGKAVEYAETALNSAGTAEQKFESYTEGIEAKINRLKATFEGFSKNLIDSDLIRFFFDATNGALEFADKTSLAKTAVEALALAVGVKSFILISGRLYKMADASRDFLAANLIMEKGIKDSDKAFARLKLGVEENTFAFSKMSVEQTIATLVNTGAINSFKGLTIEQTKEKLATLGVIEVDREARAVAIQRTLAVEGETGALQNLVMASKLHIKSIGKQMIGLAKAHPVIAVTAIIAASITAINKYLNKVIEKFEETSEEFNKLSSELKTSEEELESNKTRIKEINSMGGISFVEKDELSKLQIANALLEEQIEQLKKKKELETKDYAKDFSKSQKALDFKEKWQDFGNRVRSASSPSSFGMSPETKRAENEIVEDENKKILGQKIDQAREFLLKYETEFSKESKETYKRLYEDTKDDYEKFLEQYLGTDKYHATKFDEVLNQDIYKLVKEFVKKLKNEGKDSKEIIEQLKKEFPELYDKLGEELKKFGITIEDIPAQFKRTIEESDTFVQTISAIKEEIDNLKNVYSTLKDSVEQYNETGNISLSTWEKLMSLDSEYLGLLFDENGALVDNTHLIEVQLGAKLQQYAIEQGLNYLKSAATQTTEQLSAAIEEETNETIHLTEVQLQSARASLLAIEDGNQRIAAAQRFIAIVNSASHISFESAKATKSAGDSTKKATDNKKKYADSLKAIKNVIGDEIKGLEDEKKAIEEANKELEKQINYYDRALAYINKIIDGKISALEKEKDALKDKNDEAEREIKLQELKENMAKAQQRTMRVYYEGQGWRWESDPAAIKNAQKAFNDFNNETKQLELDKQIKEWQEYQEKWAEISQAYEDILDEDAFKQQQNFVTEQDILKKRTSGLDRFKNAYINKQKQISKNTTDEIDKQIKRLNTIKQRWDKVARDYEKASDALILEQTLGKDARETILKGDSKSIENFAVAYSNAMSLAEEAVRVKSHDINQALGSIKTPKIDLDIEKLLKLGEVKTDVEGLQYNEKKLGAISGDEFVKIGENQWVKIEDVKKRHRRGGLEKVATKGTTVYASPFASGTKNAPNGLANIDENGRELVIPPPKKGRYKMLEAGTGILPHDLTERIFAMASNPASFIASAFNSVKSPLLNDLQNLQNNVNKITNININEVIMPQTVNDADKFVRQLQIIATNR